MDLDQYARIGRGRGFFAALDQSGGSTPKALASYGVDEDAYSGDAEMFDQVHAMRTRIMTSPAFTGARVLGAILFEDTMDRRIGGLDSGEYLWSVKGIVPFLKVDKGLAPVADGVQLMKPIPALDELPSYPMGSGDDLTPPLRTLGLRFGTWTETSGSATSSAHGIIGRLTRSARSSSSSTRRRPRRTSKPHRANQLATAPTSGRRRGGETLGAVELGGHRANPVATAPTSRHRRRGQFVGAVTADPPDHTRWRRMLSREFALRRIRALEPRITAIVERTGHARHAGAPAPRRDHPDRAGQHR
ncbi:hypothetical protein [Pseudonocardia sp. GCM10023141]|uniref:hypothetical protein n=1 Tax=Pseudonocardia sp. GCM10023141 TaxID=3252653 RepID=UPI0036177671